MTQRRLEPICVSARQIAVIDDHRTRSVSIGWVQDRYVLPPAAAFRDRIIDANATKHARFT